MLKNSAPDERTCVDDNECEVDGIGLCKTREVCVNFYGGYRCDCEQGYARQGILFFQFSCMSIILA